MQEPQRVVASRQSNWFTVALHADGIIVYRPYPGVAVTHDHAKEVLQLGLQLVSSPTRVLVLMQDVARVDREARSLFASDAFLDLSYRTALVVGSPVSRVIGNFFVGLNRLKYPVKVFDDETRAMAWLQTAPQLDAREYQFAVTSKPSST